MKPFKLDPNVNYLAQMGEGESTIPEWRKSLGAFADETAAFGRGIQALGAQALGMEETRDEALKAYQQNMEAAQSGWKAPAVGRVEDIKLTEEGGLGRLGDYAAYQIPKGIGTLLTSLGGGLVGVGARVGAKAAVKKLAKEGVKKIATDLAAKEASRKGIARAALTGAGATSFGMEGGSLYGELATDPEVGPEKAFGPALIGGAASAGLELGPEIIGAKALGLNNWIKTGLRKAIKADKELSKKAKLLARTTGGGAAGIGVEGSTEGLQELVQIAAERFAKDDPMFAELDDEQKSQFWNSVAAGGLIGGLAGGAIGPFTNTTRVESSDGVQVQRETGENAEVVGGETPTPAVAQGRPTTEQPVGAQEEPVADFGVQVRKQPDDQWSAVAPEGIIIENVTKSEALDVAEQEIEDRAAKGELVVPTAQPQEATPTVEEVVPTVGEPVAPEAPALEPGKIVFVKDPTTGLIREATILKKSSYKPDSGWEIQYTNVSSQSDAETGVFPSVGGWVPNNDIFLTPETAQAQYPTAPMEVPNAQQDTQASEVHEDVPGTQPVGGQEVPLPTEEREQGVSSGRQEKTFKELSDESDVIQTQIDAFHDKLDSEGISWEDQKKNPDLEALYQSRIAIDTDAAVKAYNGALKILQDVIGEEAFTPYGKFKTILTNIYSLYPSGIFGAGTFSDVQKTLDSKDTIKKLVDQIAPILMAQENKSADYKLTMESLQSGWGRKQKEDLINRAADKAEEIQDRLKYFLTDQQYLGKEKVVVNKNEARQLQYIPSEQEATPIVEPTSITSLEDISGVIESRQPEDLVVRDSSVIDSIADSDKVLGQGWTQRAIDAGLLQLNETSEPGTGSGTYDPATGVSTVNLDKIPAGQTVLDVVAHELGSHAGMAQMLGPEKFKEFVADLLMLANSGSETALKAVRDVVDGAIGLAEATEAGQRTELQKELTNLGAKIRQAKTVKQAAEFRTQARDLLQQQDQWRFNEEVMAYYVQGASQAAPVEAGFWRRLKQAIEAWFAGTTFGQKMLGLGWSPEMSPQLATSLARAGARSVVRRAEATQKLVAGEERRLKALPAGVRQEVLASRMRMQTRTGTDARVLENPTESQLVGLLNRANQQSMSEGIRLLRDPRDGVIYAWDANENLLHKDVAAELGVDTTKYNIVPYSAQVVDENGLINSLLEMPDPQGTATELSQAAASQILHSFPPAKDLLKRKSWITNPAATAAEERNRPGYLNELLHNLVDKFHYAKSWSKEAYRALDEHQNIMGAEHELVKREYLQPMVRLVRRWAPKVEELAPFRRMGLGEPTSVKLAGHQLAARHVVSDGNVEGATNVNEYLALKMASKVLEELKPLLSKSMQQDLDAALGNSKRLPRRKAQQLLLKYGQLELPDAARELVDNWMLVRRRGSGYSTATDVDAKAADEKAGFLNANELFEAAQKNPLFAELGELSDRLGRYQLETLLGQPGRGILTQRDVDSLSGVYRHRVPLRREDFDYDQAIQKALDKPRRGMMGLMKRIGSAEHPSAANVIQNHLAAGYGAGTAAARNEMFNKLADIIYADNGAWKDKLVIRDKRRHNADVAFERDGKTLFLSPNDQNLRAIALMSSLAKLDAEQLKGPMKLMRSLNNWIRWTAVTANPAFIAANTPRDYLTARANLKASEAGDYVKEIASWKAYKEMFKVLHQVMVKDDRTPNGDAAHDAAIELVEDFEKHGGKASFVQSLRPQDSQSWRSFASQVQLGEGKKQAVVEFGEKALHSIEDLNATIENVMRLSTYKVMREKLQSEHGMTEEQARSQAGELARNLTTNFTRRGAHTDTINTWWLFYNASVQGNWQVIQNLFFNENKKGRNRLMKAVGGMMLYSFVLDQIGRATNDDWDEIPEWEKDRKIITPIKVGDDHFSIPAPWVFNIFWRAGSLLSEVTAGVKKPGDALMDLSGLVTSSMDPVGGGKALTGEGTWLQAAAPTSFDWFAQIQENKNWMGNPLGPEGFATNNRPDAYVAWDSTPEGYKGAAQFVNELTGGNVAESGLVDLRPSTYRVLAEFLMGGIGRFGVDLAETVGVGSIPGLGIVGKENVFEREGPADVPGIKTFAVGPTDQTVVSKYHQLVADISSTERLIKELKSGPNKDLKKLAKVQRDRAVHISLGIPLVEGVEQRIRAARRGIGEAVARGDSRTEKMLRDRIVQLQRGFLKSAENRGLMN